MDALSVSDGDRIKPGININKNDDGSIEVEFKCKEDSLMAVIQLKDRLLQELSNNTAVVKEKAELNSWQKFIMGLGYLFLFVIVMAIVIFCIKIFS